MSHARNQNGIRSLAYVYESGSSARVLNLIRIHKLKSHILDYQNKPLFKNKIFQKCLLIKHHVRNHEKEFFNHKIGISTKIIWPFDLNNLNAGGYYVFVGERDYKEKILQLTTDTISIDSHDFEILDAIDRLPTLDPFILQTYLSRKGFEPSNCYFDIGPEEHRLLTEFVGMELAPLIEAPSEVVDRYKFIVEGLAGRLMSVEKDPIKGAIGNALDLSEDEFEDGFFCWKGFLYYKWVRHIFIPHVKNTLFQIRRQKIQYIKTNDGQIAIHCYKKKIIYAIFDSLNRINNVLDKYDESFLNLISSQNSAEFRKFLTSAPSYFENIGTQIAAVSYISDFWAYLIDNHMIISIDEEEFIDLLDSFCRSLSAWEIALDP